MKRLKQLCESESHYIPGPFGSAFAFEENKRQPMAEEMCARGTVPSMQQGSKKVPLRSRQCKSKMEIQTLPC